MNLKRREYLADCGRRELFARVQIGRAKKHIKKLKSFLNSAEDFADFREDILIEIQQTKWLIGAWKKLLPRYYNKDSGKCLHCGADMPPRNYVDCYFGACEKCGAKLTRINRRDLVLESWHREVKN